MIDYEKEVKKVYPDAHLVQVYNEYCDNLPIGVKVVRFRKLFGITIPLFQIDLGYGFTEHKAWVSAFDTLDSEGKIIYND